MKGYSATPICSGSLRCEPRSRPQVHGLNIHNHLCSSCVPFKPDYANERKLPYELHEYLSECPFYALSPLHSLPFIPGLRTMQKPEYNKAS
jgi:hypothetical protein